MKITMLEYYRDAQNYFEPLQVVDVDASLGEWLVEHHKAVEVIAAPASRLDVEPQFEQAEEPPQAEEPQPERKKRSRRVK